MRGCLQLKAALTRLNTNLVSQRGALAALRDGAYRNGAETAIRANLAHLEQTLAGDRRRDLAVAPRRGLACALELDDEGPTAQELMVALFARRVAVYPGDGLGDQRAATTMRLNLSGPRWAMDHLRGVLGEALDEAASGRWREPVATLLDGKGTARATALAERVAARPMTTAELMAAARIPALAGRSRSRPHAPARVPRRVDARVAGRRGRLLLQDQPAAGHPARAGRRGRGSRGGVRGRVRAGARRDRRGGARRDRQRPRQARCAARARRGRRRAGRRRLRARADAGRARRRRAGRAARRAARDRRRADALRHRARAGARGRRPRSRARPGARGAERAPRLHRLRPAALGRPAPRRGDHRAVAARARRARGGGRAPGAAGRRRSAWTRSTSAAGSRQRRPSPRTRPPSPAPCAPTASPGA